jgi:hypothetical protein
MVVNKKNPCRLPILKMRQPGKIPEIQDFRLAKLPAAPYSARPFHTPPPNHEKPKGVDTRRVSQHRPT